jgi:hypothetical protein
MSMSSTIFLKGMGGDKKRVLNGIRQQMKNQNLKSASFTDLADGLTVNTEGTWYKASGNIQAIREGKDLIVNISVNGKPTDTAYLIACCGILVIGIFTVLIWFVYDSEKKDIENNFMRVAESVVNSFKE